MNSSCFEPHGLAGMSRPFASMFVASVMLASAGPLCAAAASDGVVGKFDPGVAAAWRAKSGKPLRVLIEPVAEAAKADEALPQDRPSRLRAQYARLASTARLSQAPIVRWLARRGIAYRSFTVVNAIAAELTPAQAYALARRSDVRYLADDPVVRQQLPGPGTASTKDACTATAGVTWGIDRVHADDVWALGFRGQGVVVAGQDTGYDFDHPALIAQYRGNGPTIVHDHHWHDAIHALIGAGANSCGVNLAAPCDDGSHGTHTMGTMVGENDATGFTVGVAPDAKWIGCRNMEEGDGTPSTYLECFDWFLAPTDLAGANANPALAPHVINNSWGCPTSEGCTSANWAQMNTAIDNLTTAGILVVASAGNSGPGCGSINTPAAMFANALTVAWTNNSLDNALNGGSSRGPVSADGSNRMKPDIAAPGSSVCSTVPGTGYSSGFSGTSMAGPHVAGVAALLMSAFPALKNDPPAVREILLQSASPLPQAGTCGGTAGNERPNPMTGWGLVDAMAAFQRANLQSTGLFENGFE